MLLIFQIWFRIAAKWIDSKTFTWLENRIREGNLYFLSIFVDAWDWEALFL